MGILIVAAAPILLGSFFIRKNEKVLHPGYVWVYGWIALLGLFYPFALFATHASCSFQLICSIFNVVLLAVCVAALAWLFAGRKEWRIAFGEGAALLWKNKALILCIALVVLFVLRMVFFVRINYSDDDTYTSMVNDILTMDKIFAVNDQTGELVQLSQLPQKYQYMMWMPFFAYIAKMLSVHPTILTFTLSPIVLIPMYYLIMWRFTGLFWKGEAALQKRSVCMLFLMLLNEAGWATWTTTMSVYITGGIWYGKAFVEFVPLPLFLYLFMESIDRKLTWQDFLLWAMIASSAYAASLMGVLLLPAEMLVLLIIHTVRNKSLSRWPVLFVLALPAMIIIGRIMIWFFRSRG